MSLDQIPFSANQEFSAMFEEGEDDGQFGPRNHLVHGWRVLGRVDLGTLRAALGDLVVRHEMLRTVLVPGSRHQTLLPPSVPELAVRDLPTSAAHREQRAEELLIDLESRCFPIERQPHLQAVYARFDDADGLLVLQVHHALVDGWSMRVLIRDLADLYAARREGTPPPAAPQYRDYIAAERELLESSSTGAAETYWRAKLDGARVFALPTDRPESTPAAKLSSIHRHLIPTDVVTEVSRLASTTRSTPFMVCLAALKVLFAQRSGSRDITVPTFTPGREDARFHDTVGTFFNFLPLRTDLTGASTFRDVLRRVRSTCIDAYVHDIPFTRVLEQAPELMDPAGDPQRALCVFQFFPFPYVLNGEQVGELSFAEIRRRLTSQPVSSDVPDGILWTLNLHPLGDVVGHLQFRRNRFDQRTAAALESDFQRVLHNGVTSPDASLDFG